MKKSSRYSKKLKIRRKELQKRRDLKKIEKNLPNFKKQWHLNKKSR